MCLSRFSLTKSAAKVSKEDSRRPPLRTSVRRARVSRTRRAWRVRAAKDRAKIGSFALPATSYYHACEHSARKSRADSCTHCLHARIIGLAGVDLASALTGVTISLLQWEKVARFTATDEALSYMYYQNKPYLTMFAPRYVPKLQYPVSATPTNALRALVNSRGVHELVARDVRGECVRQRTERKSVVSHSPQPHTTTRANIAHEKAEQIRARIVCTPSQNRSQCFRFCTNMQKPNQHSHYRRKHHHSCQ